MVSREIQEEHVYGEVLDQRVAKAQALEKIMKKRAKIIAKKKVDIPGVKGKRVIK